MTTRSDVTIEQGSVWKIVFTYCDPATGDPDDPDPSQPVNVTGWSAVLQVRPSFGGPVLLEASTTDGTIVVGGVDGQFRVTVGSEKTSALDRDGIFDLLATPPTTGASAERVVEGSVHTRLAVTVLP